MEKQFCTWLQNVILPILFFAMKNPLSQNKNFTPLIRQVTRSWGISTTSCRSCMSVIKSPIQIMCNESVRRKPMKCTYRLNIHNLSMNVKQFTLVPLKWIKWACFCIGLPRFRTYPTLMGEFKLPYAFFFNTNKKLIRWFKLVLIKYWRRRFNFKHFLSWWIIVILAWLHNSPNASLHKCVNDV